MNEALAAGYVLDDGERRRLAIQNAQRMRAQGATTSVIRRVLGDQVGVCRWCFEPARRHRFTCGRGSCVRSLKLEGMRSHPTTPEQRKRRAEHTRRQMAELRQDEDAWIAWRSKISATRRAQPGRPCPQGCVCGRHEWKGSPCTPGCACRKHRRRR